MDEDGWDRKGPGDLRQGKSRPWTGARASPGWFLPVPKPTYCSVFPGPLPRPRQTTGAPSRCLVSLLIRLPALCEGTEYIALGVANVSRRDVLRRGGPATPDAGSVWPSASLPRREAVTHWN